MRGQTLDTTVLSATSCFSPCQRTVIKGERHHRGTRSQAPSSWKGHCRKWAISAPCCRRGFGCRKSYRNTMPRINRLCNLLVTSPVVRGLPWIRRNNAVRNNAVRIGLGKVRFFSKGGGQQNRAEGYFTCWRWGCGEPSMGAVVLKPHYKPLIFGSCFLWQTRSSAADLYCLLKRIWNTGYGCQG